MDRRGGLVARVYLHRRFAILFYSLLLTLVAAPTSGALGVDAGLLELFLAANLLIAMASVGGERSRWALLLIVLILWAARAATLWLGHPLVALIGLGIWTLLGLFAAGAALRFAMRTRSVGGEHIYAALSAYLLVGILFGFLYWILQQAWPASFAIIASTIFCVPSGLPQRVQRATAASLSTRGVFASDVRRRRGTSAIGP